jgi:hypothetical protein
MFYIDVLEGHHLPHLARTVYCNMYILVQTLYLSRRLLNPSGKIGSGYPTMSMMVQ